MCHLSLIRLSLKLSDVSPFFDTLSLKLSDVPSFFDTFESKAFRCVTFLIEIVAT